MVAEVEVVVDGGGWGDVGRWGVWSVRKRRHKIAATEDNGRRGRALTCRSRPPAPSRFEIEMEKPPQLHPTVLRSCSLAVGVGDVLTPTLTKTDRQAARTRPPKLALLITVCAD
eukprot:scaffold1782_cov123-Isochrysis_galbana.AAC.6